MPVIQVVSNASASNEAKLQFVSALSAAFSEILRTPENHVHVLIQDGQFLSFGGDAMTPAAWVTIQASSRQILEDTRKGLIDRLVPLLKVLFGCDAHRTTTFFVEVPVENIAVGDQIIQFSSPKSPLNAGGLPGVRVMF